MNVTIDFWEYLFALLILILALLTSFTVDPKLRKYYVAGMSARLIGGTAFGFIYLFYYGGGDTIAYFQTAHAVVNLILEDAGTGMKVWLENYSPENRSLFNSSTGWPAVHIYSDPSSYAVSQILVPFLFISFKSYIIATVLFAWVFFYGPWMLFKAVRTMVVGSPWLIAFACILVPSAVFWGSGISKDNITYAASCYFTFGFYSLFLQREITPLRIIFSLVSVSLLLLIKPYIFLLLFPGTLIWSLFASIQKISNAWLRRSLLPILISVSLLLVIFLFSQLGEVLGAYSFDNILGKAIVTQEDLKKDYYGGNNFDIGTIDPSFSGLVSKFPIATFYGLYSPTIFNVRNIVMVFSALENTLLLLLTLRLLVVRPVYNLRQVFSSPFLIFCLLFTVLFGFSIGLTTPNYGALVRFKIPLLPFFTLFLFILNFRKQLRTN